jgi:xanthine dehydrogenase accessory factor
MIVWREIAGLLRRHGRCAMVTVVEVQGSAPREAGARLFVVEDGGYRGTIGGGALEWQAIAAAQRAVAQQQTRPQLSSAVLGPELGQCCGGRVKLLTEIFASADLSWIDDFARNEGEAPFSTELNVGVEPAHRRIVERRGGGNPVEFDGTVFSETFGAKPRCVFLFGAGHVGRALALALAPLPFSVTWIDSRAEAFPSVFPANVTPRLAGNPAGLLEAAPRGAFVVVMTHSHALDLDLVIAALNADRFAYVGLIGSATKRARFTSAMHKMGMKADAIGKLVCPIGLTAIRDKAPAAIAASVAAQVLMVREAAAAKVTDHAEPGRAHHG